MHPIILFELLHLLQESVDKVWWKRWYGSLVPPLLLTSGDPEGVTLLPGICFSQSVNKGVTSEASSLLPVLRLWNTKSLRRTYKWGGLQSSWGTKIVTGMKDRNISGALMIFWYVQLKSGGETLWSLCKSLKHLILEVVWQFKWIVSPMICCSFRTLM